MATPGGGAQGVKAMLSMRRSGAMGAISTSGEDVNGRRTARHGISADMLHHVTSEKSSGWSLMNNRENALDLHTLSGVASPEATLFEAAAASLHQKGNGGTSISGVGVVAPLFSGASDGRGDGGSNDFATAWLHRERDLLGKQNALLGGREVATTAPTISNGINSSPYLFAAGGVGDGFLSHSGAGVGASVGVGSSGHLSSSSILYPNPYSLSRAAEPGVERVSTLLHSGRLLQGGWTRQYASGKELDGLARDLRACVEIHFKGVYLRRLAKNTSDLLRVCTTEEARSLTVKFLERRTRLSRMGFASELTQRSMACMSAREAQASLRGAGAQCAAAFFHLKNLCPLQYAHIGDAAAGSALTLDAYLGERAAAGGKTAIFRPTPTAPPPNPMGGLSLAGPIYVPPSVPLTLEQRADLWAEKSDLEAYLWAGPAFTNSAAVAGSSGGGGGGVDVRGYVLSRLESLTSSGLCEGGGNKIVERASSSSSYLAAGSISSSSSVLSLAGYEGDGGVAASTLEGDAASIPFLPSDAQILLHYWATMLDEAAAKAAKKVLLVRMAEAKTSDRLFSSNFIEWGGASSAQIQKSGGVGGRGWGFGGGRNLFRGGMAAENLGGHPTKRLRLVVRSEAPRCCVYMKVDGHLFDSKDSGGVDGGDLPRTLALFSNLLLHEIPGPTGSGSGEIGVHNTTLNLQRGLQCVIFPAKAIAAEVD